MKYMNLKKKFKTMNLQFFAEGEDDNGGDAGEGDDQGEDNSDEDGEDDADEKKFSQKDVDRTVKERLARERRKWQREQQKKNEKPNSKEKTGDGEESEETKQRKAAENRASKAEAKVACYEAGVAKDSVDDVTALARSYMAADEDLDLEDAIEKVVKKYPHFKKNTSDSEDEEESTNKKNKSWGERQKGKSGKMSGVEKRFYELNPDLK